ncbi:MAG: transglycosylase SLT domain-containing protein [Methylotenera sp.]|nr:transglycosylase SLT domain-containing protein [Methylotenera sp.]
MGEQIIIFPDDTFTPSTKDLGDTENIPLKKPGGNRLGDALDTELHVDNLKQQENERQEVIVIESIDLWQRIKNGYDIPNSTSSLVANHENWYSSRPDYIRRMVERSQRYLFHIVEEVEKRDMPTEIALLPMIESAYNPQAYSTSRASGIWQFIPSTGKHFGLKQDWWVDNRRNVTIATDAALTYLQKLYGMFGSWDLALAAYNAGEGTVGRAIERNRRLGLPTDYESLNLPPETRNYVPKLQAIKNLMTNPGKYGLKIQTIENTAYFTKVSAPNQIDAHLAAKLAEISDDEFLALNPSNNRPVITNNGEKHDLLLPILSAQTFRDNLARYNQPLVSWKTYFAKRGERMESIASKFGIQLSKLRNINNLPAQNKIKKSSTILVPNGNKVDFNPNALKHDSANIKELTQDTESNSQLSETQDSSNLNLSTIDTVNVAENNQEEVEPDKHTNVTHVVKKNETIQSIAKRYGISAKQLKALNSLKNSKVKIGQTLKVGTRIASTKQLKSKLNKKKTSKKSKVSKNPATSSKVKVKSK